MQNTCTACDNKPVFRVAKSYPGWDMSIGAIRFTRDSEHIVCRADQAADEVFSLFSAAVPEPSGF
jgi:hypothetical protein